MDAEAGRTRRMVRHRAGGVGDRKRGELMDSEGDNAGVIAHPPYIYLATMIAGLALHFAMPAGFLPEGWLQLALGAPLMAGALALGMWGRKVMVRTGTAVNPAHSTTALVVTGPFRFTRNPLYISLPLLYIGIAVSANALWILALAPVPVWIVTVGVIRREERYLERKFGDEYLRYKARVRRWF